MEGLIAQKRAELAELEAQLLAEKNVTALATARASCSISSELASALGTFFAQRVQSIDVMATDTYNRLGAYSRMGGELFSIALPDEWRICCPFTVHKDGQERFRASLRAERKDGTRTMQITLRCATAQIERVSGENEELLKYALGFEVTPLSMGLFMGALEAFVANYTRNSTDPFWPEIFTSIYKQIYYAQ